jgi:hypothetical protein
MTEPVFGLLSELRGEFTELLNDVLLVAGGFLVGYLLGGVVGWALGKWVFKQKSTDTLKRVGRPVGGIILAIIVALIVFTGKGKAPGDGGEGKGSSTSDTAGKNTSSGVNSTKTDPKITTPKLDTTPVEQTIRVTILAGTAVPAEGKFYLLDDESRNDAKSLSELKKAIEERKAKVKGKVILAILFPEDPNLAPPRNDKKVTDVTRWATEEAGLDVTFPASR